jgi:hypothetical protein
MKQKESLELTFKPKINKTFHESAQENYEPNIVKKSDEIQQRKKEKQEQEKRNKEYEEM